MNSKKSNFSVRTSAQRYPSRSFTSHSVLSLLCISLLTNGRRHILSTPKHFGVHLSHFTTLHISKTEQSSKVGSNFQLSFARENIDKYHL